MTTTTPYQQAVEKHLAGIVHISVGLASKCGECRDRWDFCCEHSMRHAMDSKDPPLDEGGFSWADCDACGARQGGQRFVAHGLIGPSLELVHLDVCVDCVQFLANGTVPEKWEE